MDTQPDRDSSASPDGCRVEVVFDADVGAPKKRSDQPKKLILD
jgi:hypothetical protein